MAIPAKVEWATNIELDPTTLVNNRRALTTTEKDKGFVPAGMKPSRQAFNQVLHLLGGYTQYIYDELKPEVDTNTFDVTRLKRSVYNGRAVSLASNALICDIINNRLNIDTSRLGFVASSNGVPEIASFARNYLVSQTDPTNPTIVKRPDIAWSEGNLGGLKAFPALLTENYVYLFAMVGSSNNIDFATDDNIVGTNVATIVSGHLDFDSYKCIALLPTTTTSGEILQPFVYVDDYIMYYYLAGGADILTANSTSWALATVSPLPKCLVQCKILFTAYNYSIGDTATIGIASNNNSGFYFDNIDITPCAGGVIPYRFEKKMTAFDSKIFVVNSVGTPTDTANVNYSVLGYKNPLIDYWL
jgi:hypothetical protein